MECAQRHAGKQLKDATQHCRHVPPVRADAVNAPAGSIGGGGRASAGPQPGRTSANGGRPCRLSLAEPPAVAWWPAPGALRAGAGGSPASSVAGRESSWRARTASERTIMAWGDDYRVGSATAVRDNRGDEEGGASPARSARAMPVVGTTAEAGGDPQQQRSVKSFTATVQRSPLNPPAQGSVGSLGVVREHRPASARGMVAYHNPLAASEWEDGQEQRSARGSLNGASAGALSPGSRTQHPGGVPPFLRPERPTRGPAFLPGARSFRQSEPGAVTSARDATRAERVRGSGRHRWTEVGAVGGAGERERMTSSGSSALQASQKQQ